MRKKVNSWTATAGISRWQLVMEVVSINWKYIPSLVRMKSSIPCIILILIGIIFHNDYLINAEKESREFVKSGALVESSNKFAFSVFRTVQKHDEYLNKNIFFSPTSLFFALGMTHLGTRERSSAQLLRALHWDDTDAALLHSGVDSFHQMLHQHKNTDLRIANKLWIHKNIDVLDSFVEGTVNFYKTQVAKTDFTKFPEDSRREINQWVYERTGKQIDELIPVGVISHLTQVALVNAIYFKAAWEAEFDKQMTFSADFFPTIEENVEVQMMTRKGTMKYSHDEDLECQIVELFYSGRNFSMIAFLPDEKDGLSNLERKLDANLFTKVLKSLHPTVVEIHLPRFKMSQQFKIEEILARLGVTDLFDRSQADLSGITGSKDLFVSHIIHKAHLDVNEEGTEAAAASGVVIGKRSLDLHPMMHFDHPFLIFIQHAQSNAVLFAGRVVQPETPEQINSTKNTEL